MYLRALQDSNWTETNPMVEEEVSVDMSLEFKFVSSLVAAVFLILCVREFYVRRYGVDFCPVFHLFPGRRAQIERDEAYAAEVQRQLNVENHEADLEARRKDRKEWYEAFVVPYTMTVEESDFFYAQETDKNGNTILQAKLSPINRKYSSSSLDMEKMVEDATGKTEEGQLSDNDNEEVDDSQLYLRLPIRDEESNFRSVEANCTICFSEYEQGDRVVWSDLRCKHAFHYDCMLPWLIKGKKRCPVCRDWFVPGAKIEDQKRALVERLARENRSDGTGSQQGDANSREVDSSDEVNAMAGLSLQNPECHHNSTRPTDSKNQHSFEKQLSSSSEADDDTASCDCQCQDIPTDCGRRTCAESEIVPRSGEHPAEATESRSLTESNSAPAPDFESQTDCEKNDNTTLGIVPDPRTSLHEDDQQMVTSPDDQSLSELSETQAMSA